MGYRWALAAAGAAGAAWAAVMIVGLVVGVRLIPALWAVLIAAGLVVPAFMATVIDGALSGGRDRYGPFLQHIPRWARLLSYGLFLAFWLAAVTSFIGIGKFEVVNGQYVLNNHGAVTVEERVFLGVLGGFGVGVVMFNVDAIGRTRSGAA